MARANECTVSEIKQRFWDMHASGVRVIPIGPPCEGFDYQKGCQGHDIEEEASL